jgi:hypothetical protein
MEKFQKSDLMELKAVKDDMGGQMILVMLIIKHTINEAKYIN